MVSPEVVSPELESPEVESSEVERWRGGVVGGGEWERREMNMCQKIRPDLI